MDAVEELIAYRAQHGKLSPTLKRVLRFHALNRQVLDFLVLELRAARASGWRRASLGSLWHYGRWVLTTKTRVPGESFEMSNNLFPHYGRIIAILHPELNGFFGMNTSKADADFGTAFEPEAKPGKVRRLIWADSLAAIEDGWRPSKPHEPKSVKRRAPVKRAA